MRYKQVRFSEATYEWLERHKEISDLKIMNIAKFRSGELTYNNDDTITIKSGIVHHGKYSNLWVKIREREYGILIEVIIIKLHLGPLPDLNRF
jgi:hypothetical protein